MADLKEVAASLDAVTAKLGKIEEDLKPKAEKAIAEAKDAGKLSAETKVEVDKLMSSANGLREEITTLTARLEGVEQSGAREGGKAPEAKSLGARYIEDEGVKAWLDGSPKSGAASIRVSAALTTLTTDADGSVGDGMGVQKLGIVELPQSQLRVRDLLMQGQMSEGSIEYPQETGFTNAAAETAEGAAKPESTMKLDIKVASAKTIAHYFKVSRQALADVKQLRSHIDNRLIYGVKLREDRQILNGDGTGANIEGIVAQASAYAAPFTPAGTVTMIDVLRLAALQAELAELPASGYVLNPTDWGRIELLKDANDRYMIGQPQGMTPANLWRLPVVTTQGMTEDKFLAGAFNSAAQLWDREDVTVQVGYENDDFTKNLVTILGEERVALTVYRPEAFIYGDFGNIA